MQEYFADFNQLIVAQFPVSVACGHVEARVYKVDEALTLSFTYNTCLFTLRDMLFILVNPAATFLWLIAWYITVLRHPLLRLSSIIILRCNFIIRRLK